MTPIKGELGVIAFNNGSGFIPYGCATSFSFKPTIETKSVKTVGDGFWDKVAMQKQSYSLSLSGLVVADATLGVFDLMALQFQGIAVDFQLLFTDDNLVVRRVEGRTLITSTTLSAPSDGFCTGDLEMQGIGAPIIYNNSGVCAAAITNSTLSGTPPNRHLVFAASSDTEYISYELRFKSNNSILNSGTVTKTAFDATIPSITANNLLYVVATPYCINNVAGTVYTHNF